VIKITQNSLVDTQWSIDSGKILAVYQAASISLLLDEKKYADMLFSSLTESNDWIIQKEDSTDFQITIDLLEKIVTEDKDGVLWVIENLGELCSGLPLSQQRVLQRKIVDTINLLDRRSIALLFVDYGTSEIPDTLKSIVPKLLIPLPSVEKIEEILGGFNLSSPRLTAIVSGLRVEEIKVGIKLACQNRQSTSIKDIENSLLAYKIKKLQELGLEFIAEGDVADFGGLDLIAHALAEVKEDFTPRATEEGIPLPRGWMLVGPPGTGKTHTAKCAATQLGFPLINVGIDSIKSGGAEFFKLLLLRIEACAPCLIYFDELDKFFTKDTDAQVRGVLLTWLQEKRSRTFVMATLNRFDDVPTELTRSGRFDRLFWVGFPSEGERFDIIKLYAKKYDKRYAVDMGGMNQEQWMELMGRTLNFTGAELKVLVDRAAKTKFYLKQPLELNLEVFLEARKYITPLYERNPAGILEIEKQAKAISEPSSSPDKSLFKLESVSLYG
jgi:ATP-dependent 26S proteasome regulatory subunit